jgi:small subunit ribosomal protein S2
MQRLITNLDGMREMKKYPQAMFVIDLKKEHNAVSEAIKLNIPIVGLVDTNADPTVCAIPIAGNDDSIRAIRIILNSIQKAIGEARSEFESIQSRKKHENEQVPTITRDKAILMDDVEPIIDKPASTSSETPSHTIESEVAPTPTPISIENFEPVGPTGPAANAAAHQKQKDA